MIKKIFDNKTNITSRSFKTVRSYAFYAALAIGAGLMMSELAFATKKWDIDGGIKASASTVVQAIIDHWGKGVIVCGAAAAIFGEGDLRQRATRAALGSVSAGMFMLGSIAMFNN